MMGSTPTDYLGTATVSIVSLWRRKNVISGSWHEQHTHLLRMCAPTCSFSNANYPITVWWTEMLRCLTGQRVLCVPSAGVTLVGWNLNEVSNYHVSVAFIICTTYPWSILELWLCSYGDGFYDLKDLLSQIFISLAIFWILWPADLRTHQQFGTIPPVWIVKSNNISKQI